MAVAFRPDIYFVQGDIPPTPWSVGVYDENNAQQLLTNIDHVTFTMYAASKPRQPPVINAQPAVATVGSDGYTRLQYSPSATDLQAISGEFKARFAVYFTGGKLVFYPDPSWIPVHGAQATP